jgi:hypothetical protein
MNGRVLIASFWISAAVLVASPAAQSMVQTSSPTVTADYERWYLNGEPITYAGNFYFPAGAQIYFNASEMIRSGFYMGVPLYTRTTLEPYSVVFVPLAGGRMQPYERPRSGELTGTTGSIPTTLPSPAQTVPPPGLAPQAAGPPSQTTQVLAMQLPRPLVADSAEQQPRIEPPVEEPSTTVGTTGRAPRMPMHTRIGGQPQGTNSMFVEYGGRRWYPLGPPRPIDASRLTRVGDFHGFDVWGNGVDPSIIFIPSTRGSSLGVAYVRVRPPH